MKQLSIEEKAKAYDEAIEKLRNFYRDYDTVSRIIDVKEELANLFPEIKESDDERIRMSLIELFKDMEWDDSILHDYNMDKDKTIAWLEKQGEQKTADKVEPKFKIKYAGSEYNVLEVKDIAGVTYYGIEDEPNHIDYVQAENCERVDGYSIKESGSPFPTKPAKFSEQNSTWSEEDEKGLGGALWCCKQAASIAKNENDMGNAWYAENWLKSLKDRVQPQPKQEWSEEDERLFQIVIDILDKENHLGNISHTDLIDCVRKLKSLRPQNNITDEELAQAKKDAYNDALDKIEYHCGKPTFDDGWSAAIWYLKKRNAQPQSTWKPSDEQMKAF